MFLNKIGSVEGLRKHDFGEYLPLVEGSMFEVENVVLRYKSEIKKKKFLSASTWFKIFFCVFSCIIAPCILLLLAYGATPSVVPIQVEMSGYVIWLAIGAYLIKKRSPRFIINIKTDRENNINLRKGLLAILQYGSATIESFFKKSETINNGFIQDLTQEEVLILSKALDELEFDISFFDNICHKHREFNEKTIILDDNFFEHRRSFSFNYLNVYFNKQIKDYAK